MIVVRWRKKVSHQLRWGPWSKWHVQSDHGRETLCGIAVPDETCGTSYETQTGDTTVGKEDCKSCFHSYFGLGPQFKRISEGKQDRIVALNEGGIS